MLGSFKMAWELILSGDRELINILIVTARTCLTSSLIALIIGVPLGIWLGTTRFRGRHVFIVLARTLMGMPPVVAGLLMYILFSGVGPFGKMKLLFTVTIMIIAQVVLITPLVIANLETYVSPISQQIYETACGLGLGRWHTFRLLYNECLYPVFSTYLLAFSRAIAEVGAVSMVGGAIAWKTNVMTTAIMLYTNRGSFTLGIALGMILIALSLLVNIAVTLMQRRLSA